MTTDSLRRRAVLQGGLALAAASLAGCTGGGTEGDGSGGGGGATSDGGSGRPPEGGEDGPDADAGGCEGIVGAMVAHEPAPADGGMGLPLLFDYPDTFELRQDAAFADSRTVTFGHTATKTRSSYPYTLVVGQSPPGGRDGIDDAVGYGAFEADGTVEFEGEELTAYRQTTGEGALSWTLMVPERGGDGWHLTLVNAIADEYENPACPAAIRAVVTGVAESLRYNPGYTTA